MAQHRARPGSRRTSLALLLALALACGPAAAAGKAKAEREDKARQKAAAKLSPGEIMKAGDEAARGGDLGRAMNFYMQALELEPSADLWFRVGFVYNALDKKPYAAQAFGKAVELAPDHAAANEELGLILLQHRGRAEAATYLARAVAADPGRWRSLNALGALADADGRYEEARRHYEAALAARPGLAIVLNNLGYSYYLSGDYEQAAARYREALQAEPGHRPTMANLALLHARQQRYPEALDVLVGAVPKAKAYNDVGYVAYQNGDLAVAERLIAEAIRASPTYYATAQENLKRVREAMAEAKPPAAPEPVAAVPAQGRKDRRSR